MRNQRIRLLVEIALTIALSAVLNVLKIWQMPQGGTVSLVMLPIIVLALRRGVVAGTVAGALYGVVDLLVDYVPPVHPVQFVLDYPLAYALVGLAGLFAGAWAASRSKSAMTGLWTAIVPAVVLASLARYASHVASGAVFFGQYAPKGQPVLVYSLIYNSYVLISGALALAVAAVVMPALSRALDAPVTSGDDVSKRPTEQQ